MTAKASDQIRYDAQHITAADLDYDFLVAFLGLVPPLAPCIQVSETHSSVWIHFLHCQRP
jgi:hypothetical protein